MSDERGGETLEYAMLLAFLVLGSLLALTAFAPRVVHRWTAIRDIL